jgi:hypothetical protein
MKKYAFLLIQGVFLFQLYGTSQNNGTKEALASLISVVQVNNKLISSLVQTSFSNLTVNAAAVKDVTGIQSFTTADFDFVNLYKSEKKGEVEIAYSAPYKGAGAKEKYAFTVFMKNGTPFRSVLVKAAPDRSSLIFYDLKEGKTAEIVKSNNLFVYAVKSVNFGGTAWRLPQTDSCGKVVMNCITDAYSNHGWASVWLTIQSIFVPATAVAITIGCMIANCK